VRRHIVCQLGIGDADIARLRADLNEVIQALNDAAATA